MVITTDLKLQLVSNSVFTDLTIIKDNIALFYEQS